MRSGTLGRSLMVVLFACAAVAAAEPVRVIYVDAVAGGAKTGVSWADAYNSLQDALAAARAAVKPIEIRVAQGIYKPDHGTGITPGDRLATFQLLDGVALKGGYAGVAGPDPNARDVNRHETILSGDLAGNDGTATVIRDPGAPDFPMKDNTCNIVTGSGTDNTAVIDGFTVTAGSMSSIIPYGSHPLVGGAGMLIETGSPTVLNCCFVANYPASKEALLARNGSNPIVTNCIFSNNQGAAMGASDNSNAVLTHCRFEGNAHGALRIRSSSPVITSCQFVGNGMNAVIASDCNSVLTDCLFEGASSQVAGEGIDHPSGHLTLSGCTFTGFKRDAISTRADLTLVRCVFRDNPSYAGAVNGSFGGHVIALECTFVGNEGYAGAISASDIELHDCEFTGNSGSGAGAIATEMGRGTLIATGCVFSGNSSRFGAGAISVHTEVLKLSNCTFAGNHGRPNAIGFSFVTPLVAEFTQCIVWDGPEPFASYYPFSAPVSVNVAYSDVQGGYPGEGNIDVDPCFVNPGYWASRDDLTTEAGRDDPNAVWVAGDYHLKSQGGHWDRAVETWVCDEVTSVCIDAGDPNGLLGVEPFPNGGFVNLGAYGGTTQASKSYFGEPICESQLAGDINGDCRVNNTDIDIVLMHWLMKGIGLANVPPTVTLISPKDGDELTYPAPIILQSTASDLDGVVVRVMYMLEHREGGGRYTSSITITDPTNSWDQEWLWSNVRYDGTWTIWAEAMDNEGARTVSPAITVTLHPAK